MALHFGVKGIEEGKLQGAAVGLTDVRGDLRAYRSVKFFGADGLRKSA
jgi:hypothetical protein